MDFYDHQSVSIWPFKLDVSKSGGGYSVGGKGKNTKVLSGSPLQAELPFSPQQGFFEQAWL